ncbi:MAG: DUF6125 family protein, partial [Nitrososphaerota archaeon]
MFFSFDSFSGSFSKEEIFLWLEDASKLWLAHDGLWFQEVEKKFGLDLAIELDKNAWEKFSPLEAKRIMERLKIEKNGGLEALSRALKARLYTILNEDELILKENELIYTMKSCRVQEARKRKNLPLFPCKEVGIIEY